MNKYRDLIVWQKSMDLVINVYGLTKLFPSEEKFELARQINRSAVSVPSNIAEGAGRNSPKEFNQFLGIAQGSLAELSTQIEISFRLSLIRDKDSRPIIEEINRIGKMISNLQAALQKTYSKNLREPEETKYSIDKGLVDLEQLNYNSSLPD